MTSVEEMRLKVIRKSSRHKRGERVVVEETDARVEKEIIRNR